jgi:hypothetical protein
MAKSRTKAKTHYTHEELLCIWSELAEIIACGNNDISIPKLIIEKWGVCRPTADKWYEIERGMRTNQLGSVIGAVRLQSEMLGLIGK